MLRSLIVTVLLLSVSFVFSSRYIGYSRAGKEYFSKESSKRKSLRVGSGYYVPYRSGSGSFRSGK